MKTTPFHIGLFLIIIGSMIGCRPVNSTGGNSKSVPDKPDIQKNSGDTSGSAQALTVCTFNIQFLGSFKKRDHASLSEILKDYDIAVIQEMTAPPVSGRYPDSSRFTADPESAAFLHDMVRRGFRYLLSEEDTGSGEHNHSNGTGTEWFVCFYDSASVTPAGDLPHGFLASDRSDNPDYERVPYAFPFRMVRGKNDFVLISVHLNPGSSSSDRERRAHEVASISDWINHHNQDEKDFFILGDMNIEDSSELVHILPDGMKSLNDECRTTNTLVNHDPPRFGGRPYDQVFYYPAYSAGEVDTAFDCKVIDLRTAMKPFWKGSGPYPGDPYVHDLFRQYYSDHNPLIFRVRILDQDDD